MGRSPTVTADGGRQAPPSPQSRVARLALFVSLLSSCTATTVTGVVERLPPDILVEEVLLLETDYVRCTFAKIRTAPGSAVSQDVVRQSLQAFARLDANEPHQRLAFPPGGFAAFPGRSIIDVTGDLDGAGDEHLAESVEMTIWSAKDCWDDHIADDSLRDGGEFWRLASDAGGIVILGEEWPHTAVMFLPDQQLAYYFGP